MRLEGDGQLLRIFIGESDRWEGRPLHEAIVHLFKAAGLAGTTVIRGVEGFGRLHHLHTDRLLSLSEDLPVVSIAVDRRELSPDAGGPVKSTGFVTRRRDPHMAGIGGGREHRLQPFADHPLHVGRLEDRLETLRAMTGSAQHAADGLWLGSAAIHPTSSIPA